MKRMAMVLLLSAGLVTVMRAIPKTDHVLQACADDGGDSDDDGDEGDGDSGT